MRLSIRNQLDATILSVSRGDAMAAVKAQLASGQEVTAAITRESADELELIAGLPVTMLVKATDVALATGAVGDVSIRNQLPGRITSLTGGAAMTTLKVAVDGGGALTAVVTNDAVNDLDLSEGDEVLALVKATEVSVAIN
ncbi:molybdenum-binding protein [Asanoa ishikariensis]|uniref:Molybdate transport system regulatory protein n=1 Tax=Asanoa ishikariensis TaxID=137265 RepID=A0A1H3T4H1_9ACTN|nr:TOBE domain-containing protein [Asanoa ishikariensis]GIF63012.1 molybdenum-binding protein [Asanoa ishikariensis]SDZ45094.1 molybdate transport system regulatory protein [Asanoa ishikariensis]